MKTKIQFFVLFLCVSLFSRCSLEEDLDPISINTNSISQVTVQDQIAVRVAEGLHNIMKYPEVRAKIKNAISNQFDGDYNVLLAEIVNESITVNQNNDETIGSLLLTGINGKNALIESSVNSTQKNLLDSIAEYYPLMQLAIPQLEELNVNDWDVENEPLPLAIVTAARKSGKIPTIDVDGKVSSVSTAEAPIELYLVISENERVTVLPKAKNNSFEANVIDPGLDCTGDAYLEDIHNEYILNSVYYEAQNDCSLAGLPSSANGTSNNTNDPSCDRDSNSGKDYIKGLRYNNINLYRRHMDDDNGDDAWFNGGLEVHVEIRFGQANGTISKLTKIFTGNRGAWRECGFLWTNCDTKWYNTLTEIVTWNKNTYGDAMHYVWFEKDGGGTVKETIKWTSKIGDIPVEFSDERTVNIEDDQLGDSVVEYCDNTEGDGFTYDTGSLFFIVGQ